MCERKKNGQWAKCELMSRGDCSVQQERVGHRDRGGDVKKRLRM